MPQKIAPLYIASDHRGFQLKKRLIRYLENELHRSVEDLGPSLYQEGDDYPDYAIPLAKKVAKTNGARGILICHNGIGICIAGNKVRGIRAGLGYNLMAAATMMADDNTNILCLASGLTSDDHALAIVKRWLHTRFSGEARHKRRLKKVAELEK
jgi:ribose 5-phosphate isomerase B